MKENYLVFPEGKSKALTLSYDDGVNTDIRMIELMEKYGIKCTFNLNGGRFGAEGEVQVGRRLPKSMVKTVYTHPLCEVATHSYTHAAYNHLPESVIMSEILDDRRELEKMFGCVVRGHAYPYGCYNDSVIDILKKAGIVYARTVESHRTFKLPDDWLRWGATCHHNEPKLMELADKFTNEPVGLNSDGWLFYLWGHTYEFPKHNNWNVIEEFFERISQSNDIWFATNMEVYEYVTAWRGLVYSADGGCVYNPSAQDLWVKQGGKIVHVPAGETVIVA